MKQSYNNFASEFNETRKNPWPEFLEFNKYLKKGQRILDLGCGNGRLIDLLKNYEIEYLGCDICEPLLNYAKKQDLGKIKQAHFVFGDMMRLNFNKSSFDVIFLIASFHHLRNVKQRARLLKKMEYWLKPKGIIVMTNWNLLEKKQFKKYFKYLFDFRHRKTFRDFIIPFKNNKGKAIGRRFYHAFTLKELDKLFQNARLESIKSELSKDKKNIITYLKKINF